MLAIMLWLSLGVLVGIAALIVLSLVIDSVDSQRAQARARVDQERRAAERRLQAITQSAMQEMLSIARNYP